MTEASKPMLRSGAESGDALTRLNALPPRGKYPNSTRILDGWVAKAQAQVGVDHGRLGWLVQPAVRAAIKSNGHNTSPTSATAQLAEALAENRGLRVELARADGSRPQSASPLDRQSGITNCSRPRRRQQRGAHLTPLGGLAMSRACRQCPPGLSKFTVYGSSSTTRSAKLPFTCGTESHGKCWSPASCSALATEPLGRFSRSHQK